MPSSNKRLTLISHLHPPFLHTHTQLTEDCFRIYHEVEDVGKTVRATKRRARWTFSFGEKGQERVSLLCIAAAGFPFFSIQTRAPFSNIRFFALLNSNSLLVS